MSPVHGVADLEGNNPVPSQGSKSGSQLCRAVAEIPKVVMGWKLYAFNFTTQVNGIFLMEEAKYPWVILACGAEDELRLFLTIRLPNVSYCHNRQHYPLGMAEGNTVTP